MKILSTAFSRAFAAWTIPEWAIDELRAAYPEAQVVRLTSPDRIAEELEDTDILFATVLKDQHIQSARKLQWIHTSMAGLDGILIPSVIHSAIRVSNSKGVHAIPMAEHTLALMLSLSRKLPQTFEAQRQGVIRRAEHFEQGPSFEELRGKTIGIVGFGSIGLEVARLASAFGMRVIGFKRSELPPNQFVEVVAPPRELNSWLPNLDYIVVAAPLTAETAGLFGAEQFRLMKSSAFFVNVARGEIVRQEELVEALENGQIAGAAIDVTIPDPLPEAHPLYFTRNLLITPHTSGVSPMLWRRIMDLWLENMRRFLSGEPLINEVRDKTLGY